MIHLKERDAARILTIDRQDKANSLTGEMLETLANHIETLNADDTVKAIFLTGVGKVFSAGADLDEARAGLATSPVWERLSAAVVASPCLTIAALNGTAAGGALGMVLACDLRIAVPGAKIFYPVMKLGFLPQPSDPPRLANLVGPARAKLILMGGQKIPVDEAFNMGLVDRISDNPLEHAFELAEDVVGAKRTHVSGIKKMIPAS